MALFYSTKLVYSLLLASLTLGYGVIELQASRHVQNVATYNQSLLSDDQPYRTAYHFQPLKNWMNVLSGPMIYRGIYHLFYQYNPIGDGSPDGPRVWGHSTSLDMVNWTPQPLTLQPQMVSNMNGSYTGSITILQGYKPAILFTGITPKNEQVQDLALPKDLSDPFLKEWVLVPQNPLMYPTLENNINASSFRDPTTAWMLPDGNWRVVIGSKIDRLGLALLFKSRDFINWVQVDHPLYSYDQTGMWECPDFFPVYRSGLPIGVDTSAIGPIVKHVLKISLDDTKHDVYTIGTYDTMRDAYVPDVGFENDSSLRYDYGKYYAAKTFYDSSKMQRILLSWVNESSSLEDDIKKGWSGIHAIPRRVWLDTSKKQLIQWPISEIELLRVNPVILPTQVLKGGSTIEILGITAAQADVELLFRIRDVSIVERFDASWTNPQLLCSQKGASVSGGLGPFGLLTLASKGLEEYTAVFFRIFKDYDNNRFVVLMCSDQSRSSLNPTPDKTTYGTFVNVDPTFDGLRLRTLIDHSIVESFASKGKNVITARVYPTLAIYDKAHLYAFNYGNGSVDITWLTAWSMRKANIA
uniref:Uncharacterized protein n=1 Tax=Chenopodium quinoa TaxID=63459 RepID=A0A803LD97_CHEQI